MHLKPNQQQLEQNILQIESMRLNIMGKSHIVPKFKELDMKEKTLSAIWLDLLNKPN